MRARLEASMLPAVQLLRIHSTLVGNWWLLSEGALVCPAEYFRRDLVRPEWRHPGWWIDRQPP
eukprot:2521641-Prorocentrum_lima.AAC.1